MLENIKIPKLSNIINNTNKKFYDIVNENKYKKLNNYIKNNIGELPVKKYFHSLMKSVNQFDNIMIVAETGAGKTTQNPKFLWSTSLDVRATNPSPIEPSSIDITLTPEQFEQITGLDASLVFDQEGQVLTARPTRTQKPLEPQ